MSYIKLNIYHHNYNFLFVSPLHECVYKDYHINDHHHLIYLIIFVYYY